MFIVYHSNQCNQLEPLADQLAALVRQPTDSPFVPETIIVQSLGMARWLSFRLADHLGVCVHVWFPFPAAFIWDIFHRVLTRVPETSPFAPEVISRNPTAASRHTPRAHPYLRQALNIFDSLPANALRSWLSKVWVIYRSLPLPLPEINGAI